MEVRPRERSFSPPKDMDFRPETSAYSSTVQGSVNEKGSQVDPFMILSLLALHRKHTGLRAWGLRDYSTRHDSARHDAPRDHAARHDSPRDYAARHGSAVDGGPSEHLQLPWVLR